MRYLLPLLFILSISCTGKIENPAEGFFSSKEFYLDTVVIDPGNDIIFLKHQLLNADLSKDRRYFYNFNEQDHTLEKINLDESRLEEKIPIIKRKSM